MTDDARARGRALEPSVSFIVQAPAGSGKTELLIQRYLRLLSEVAQPESVVAITFTKKAAGEMRARVIAALQSDGALDAPHLRVTRDLAARALAHERRLGWGLLRNPARMRIETIDALCASITRQMPWLARFGAPPEITEKAQDLYHDAARNTLGHVLAEERAGRFGPLSDLLLHLDNDFAKASTLIGGMLEKRDQWLRLTGAPGRLDLAQIRARLERSLEKLILSAMDELRRCFDDEIARELALLRELDCFPGATLDDIPAWKSIADLLLTTKDEWRNKVDARQGFHPKHPLKRRCEELLNRLRHEDTLLEALKTFRGLPNPRFNDAQWKAMEAVLAILPIAVAELELVFRERGRVDFAELSIRASAALGTEEHPTDLALALGYRIQHLLVDEFQDTSWSQFELLRKLTAGWEPGDGRTLFLVGDPMQSIYRFRQAEVSLFLKARMEGIGAIELEPLRLISNFRSRPPLVAWVNETLAQVFPAREDAANGAVAYSPFEPHDGAADIDAGPAVSVHPFFDSASEAERAVALAEASAQAGRTAILVRARSHLGHIIPALKAAGIRFQAIEIDELGRRPVIQDLMALTFALLHPADRVSWLAILRAPWCGLSLHDLHALMEDSGDSTVWELLQSPALPLSGDALPRLRRILPVLAEALDARARMPLRDWVENAWYALGGPACLRAGSDLEDAAAYFDLLESLEQGADLTDFTWFRRQVSELFAQPDSAAGDALQIMTIHKAKGLEFDTVILPGLSAGPRQDDAPLLLWQEQGGELLLAPISATGKSEDPIFRYLARAERDKARYENARLLYVAATRARSQLHLLATVKMDEKTGRIATPASGSFLNLLWPAVAAAFPLASGESAPSPPVGERRIYRLPASWTVPLPPPAVEWTPFEAEPVRVPEVTFEWVGDTLRHVGTALHRYLQRIAREGLSAWTPAVVRAHRGAYRAVLANLGVAPREIESAAARVETGLLQVLDDARGRWVLGDHPEAACEYAVSGLIDGQLYHAVVDRTFVGEDGARWIVDYKTSSHEGGGVEAFLNNEKLRYAAQLERYARLLLQPDQRPIRLGLYFPLLNGWREWPLPAPQYKQASLFFASQI